MREGSGVLAADLAADAQLRIVEFSADLRGQITRLVNQTTGTANPVDAGAAAGPAQIAAIASAVLTSDEVDAVVVALVATGANDPAASATALAEVRRQHPERPLVVVPLTELPVDHADVTMFRTSAAALGALGRAAKYVAWRGLTAADPGQTDRAVVRRARTTARSLLGAASADGWVHPEAAHDLLDSYDINLVGRFARSAAEAWCDR